eukprot:3104081-Prymnesium_polylepis.1
MRACVGLEPFDPPMGLPVAEAPPPAVAAPPPAVAACAPAADDGPRPALPRAMAWTRTIGVS